MHAFSLEIVSLVLSSLQLEAEVLVCYFCLFAPSAKILIDDSSITGQPNSSYGEYS